MNTLAVEHLASLHPSISFVHVFPGIVRTPLMNKTIGSFAGAIVGFFSRPMSISAEESGERNVFISTSAAYPPAAPENPSNVGVPLVGGLKTAVASTGKVGGGAYILNYDGANAAKEKVLSGYRAQGFPNKVWDHTLETFKKAFDPAQ
jgi:hypothetical protein